MAIKLFCWLKTRKCQAPAGLGDGNYWRESIGLQALKRLASNLRASFCFERRTYEIQTNLRGSTEMKWIVALTMSFLIFDGNTVAVKKADRGVLVSARELAASCQAMKDAIGEDYVLGPQQGGRPFARPATSDIDMAPIGRCMGYIEGVA